MANQIRLETPLDEPIVKHIEDIIQMMVDDPYSYIEVSIGNIVNGTFVVGVDSDYLMELAKSLTHEDVVAQFEPEAKEEGVYFLFETESGEQVVQHNKVGGDFNPTPYIMTKKNIAIKCTNRDYDVLLSFISEIPVSDFSRRVPQKVFAYRRSTLVHRKHRYYSYIFQSGQMGKTKGDVHSGDFVFSIVIKLDRHDYSVADEKNIAANDLLGKARDLLKRYVNGVSVLPIFHQDVDDECFVDFSPSS